LNYDVVQNSDFSWNTGVVLSSYRTELQEFVIDANTEGNLGAPGQNGTNVVIVEVGEEIGNIWGPVFEGVDPEGNPIFADINGDGQVIAGQDRALDEDVDFQVLGNGVPDLELGWTNQINIGNWSINAFFRGAFGHSLVNTFRAFYEPQLSTQSSYNFVDTELAVDGLTTARFSSFNLTVSRRFDINNSAFRGVTVSLTATNPFVITNYTGTDPEPNLVDTGALDNGGTPDLEGDNKPNVLAPGIDRRNNYFAARSFILGLNLNF